MSEYFWDFLDNSWFAITVLATLTLFASALLCPLILLTLVAETQKLRQAVEDKPVCQCSRPGHLPLPHVFPRLRRQEEMEHD